MCITTVEDNGRTAVDTADTDSMKGIPPDISSEERSYWKPDKKGRRGRHEALMAKLREWSWVKTSVHKLGRKLWKKGLHCHASGGQMD
ncbi:hypothetical protein AMEX_G4593 [Astyanax mexicanus]|uniref:Uncharacterized protein n=1 Tax=Astyanax mexicanus TaxID=7994 RepID=A0A8T2ME35_ASTMX|nr:hypothetical protein AMEX_G4593 [Astyanax mexicanus]